MHWKGGINRTPWLELFKPFTSMKNLYLTSASCATCRACLGRSCWRKGNRSVSCSRMSFLRGSKAIRSCSGSLSEFRICETALWSPCGHLPMVRVLSALSLMPNCHSVSSTFRLPFSAAPAHYFTVEMPAIMLFYYQTSTTPTQTIET